MGKYSNRYDLDNVKLWAARYRETLSFMAIAREFGVCKDTVSKLLHKYKKDLDIQFKDEVIDNMYKDGLKTCPQCGETKKLEKFFKMNRGRGYNSICKDCKNGSRYKNDQERIELAKQGSKRCSVVHGCGQIKSMDSFHKNVRSKDGLAYLCKDCMKKHRSVIRGKRVHPDQTQLKQCTGKYGCGKIKPLSDFDYNHCEKRYISHCKECRILRYKKNIIARLAANLRSRIRSAIKNGQKRGSAVRDLGCTIDELKVRLEMQFYTNPETGEEMSWDNYSYYGWHVDHIVPLSSFDLSDREQFLKACHYTNLQPLWAKENFEKNANIL